MSSGEVLMNVRSDTAPRTVSDVRHWFPSLRGGEVYLDNAGGSQIPSTVIDRIVGYFQNSYVQLSADYEASRRATQTVKDAHQFVRHIFGGDGLGDVILGPSTSALLNMLAQCYAQAPLGDRNEIIISEANHESNIGPWARLEKQGFTVRMWRVDPTQMTTPLEALRSMRSERTLLVAMPHVSNIFGAVEDVQEACRLAREVGARTVVDSVAYAPHRPLDVAELGADWCVYSTYKVYGPHMAALFGVHDALAELEGPNHYFIPRSSLPSKFELGGVCHEGCAGLLGLWPYLRWLAGAEEEATPSRAAIRAAFELIGELELPLQERLIGWLAQRDDLRILGPATAGPERVPTISFVAPGRSSKEIAQALNARGVGVRYGHFYSWRLLESLGMDPTDGVVRASFAHYNSVGEVDRLTEALEAVLAR